MSEFLVKTSGLDLDENDSVETVMLIHGWGMNSQVWSGIREFLESKYHLIWVDLPGHGFNRDVEVTYQGVNKVKNEANNLDKLDKIVELLQPHTPENVNIIAWSLGGMVAQALASKYPDRIQKLLLVATTPKFSQNTDPIGKSWKHAMSQETLHRFGKQLKQNTLKTLKGFIALQFIGVENAKAEQDALIANILTATENNLENAKKVGGAPQLPQSDALDVGLDILMHSDLREITPTWPEHWIFGEYDRLIPKEIINDLKYLRPNAQITLLEKAGHAPFITHQEAFLENLTGFIDEQY